MKTLLGYLMLRAPVCSRMRFSPKQRAQNRPRKLGLVWGWYPVSLPYKQRAFIIYDNDDILKNMFKRIYNLALLRFQL